MCIMRLRYEFEEAFIGILSDESNGEDSITALIEKASPIFLIIKNAKKSTTIIKAYVITIDIFHIWLQSKFDFDFA